MASSSLTLEQLEAEALRLPEESRAHLFERLLRSFTEAPDVDAEIARTWGEEAARRDQAMDAGIEKGIPAEEVFARLRSSRR